MNKISSLNIVIIGLSITSSWGNGHATTYRALVKALSKRGHKVLFLEKDVPWYAMNRDLPNPTYCQTILYSDFNDLNNYKNKIKNADIVIVGSYVPDGVKVGKFVLENAEGLKAFYDIDTPVTLAKLEKKDYEYLSPDLISHYDLYLSFSGGPILKKLEKVYKSPSAKPFYCSVDPENYFAEKIKKKWDLGYLGTYSIDRQPALEKLLIYSAKNFPEGNFVVAGPAFPQEIKWTKNIERIEHLPPNLHREFYNSQRFTLNITRTDMIKAGYSPSVRLFEAAACGVPIISDYWEGIEDFFIPGKEILIALAHQDTLSYLNEITEKERIELAANAREKVLSKHTAEHRAIELENYYQEIMQKV